MYLWKASQIRQAVERAEKESEEMVKRRARPEEITKKREGIATLRRWLEEAEKNEAMWKVWDEGYRVAGDREGRDDPVPGVRGGD